MWKIFFEWFAYAVAACLILLPIGLSMFTLFLMLTYPATEEEIIESGHWLTDEELDQIRKKH